MSDNRSYYRNEYNSYDMNMGNYNHYGEYYAYERYSNYNDSNHYNRTAYNNYTGYDYQYSNQYKQSNWGNNSKHGNHYQRNNKISNRRNKFVNNKFNAKSQRNNVGNSKFKAYDLNATIAEVNAINQSINQDKMKHPEHFDRYQANIWKFKYDKELNDEKQEQYQDRHQVQKIRKKDEKILVKKDNPYHPANFYKKQNKKDTQSQSIHDDDEFNKYYKVVDDDDNDSKNDSYSPIARAELNDVSEILEMKDSIRVNKHNIKMLRQKDTVLILSDNNVDFNIVYFETISNYNKALFREFNGKLITLWLNDLPPIFKPNGSSETFSKTDTDTNTKNDDHDDDGNGNIEIGTKIFIELDDCLHGYTITNYDYLTTKATLIDAQNEQHVMYLNNTVYEIGSRSKALPILPVDK